MFMCFVCYKGNSFVLLDVVRLRLSYLMGRLRDHFKIFLQQKK